MAGKFRTGPAFTQLVPVHPSGTDPSHNHPTANPAVLRSTETFRWIERGNGSGLVGQMSQSVLPVGPVGATATITVVQANVTPGTHLIRVGKYELRPAVDFVVGANDIALAANLATAIDALPGYDAASDGIDTVTITTTADHGSDHLCEVVEWGAASAFTVGGLGDAPYMTRGIPQPEAPEFT